MAKLNYDCQYGDIIICLGYFDCAHIGHLSLINKAKLHAKEYNCSVGVFTFKNNPFSYFGHDTKSVYTLTEREYLFGRLNIDVILETKFDESFVSLEPDVFLDNLTKNKNVIELVVGKDYTYGKNADGNVITLSKYCKLHNINLVIEDTIMLYGKKVSSTNVREYLLKGEIEKVNELLSFPYFIQGIVQNGRKDGSKMGTPTINIHLNNDRIKPKNGVYSTSVVINNKRYLSVTNIGNHPTFDDDYINCETHIIDFNGDLYGKSIIVEFYKRIRDIKKFNSKIDLKEQILKDIKYTKELKI